MNEESVSAGVAGTNLRQIDNDRRKPVGARVGEYALYSEETMLFIREAARFDEPVMILGDTGTGKSTLARLLHEMSARHDRPFVRKGCGEFDPGTGAAALFGHSRGAFTDAKTSQEGLLDLANGGTLLLDDVDYMPLELQTKLIRFLDDATYAPLGRPNDLKTADVRIIATSNKPLDDLIREGRFLHDLDARLRDWTVQLPSLKQDRHHLLRLARHFLSAEQQRSGLRVEECRILSPEAEVALVTLEYPYNARDLMRLVKRIIRLDRSVHREISAKLISVAFNISRPSIQRYRTPTYSPKFERIRNVKSDRLTDEDIYRSLVGNGWVIQRTAEDLCLSRTTIYNKIKKNNWRKAT